MQIRDERPEDATAIGAITQTAFAGKHYSDQTEHRVIEGLREAGALTLSLVAVRNEEIVGHIAFSPVAIEDRASDWYGLGPVSVTPELQGLGIGAALIREGLDRLKDIGARGCVLLGDPRYYGRFGFINDPKLTYSGGPPTAFQRLLLEPRPPKGEVTFHPAFDVA